MEEEGLGRRGLSKIKMEDSNDVVREVIKEQRQDETKLVMVKDILERSVKSRMEIGHLFVDILSRLEALESGKRKRE